MAAFPSLVPTDKPTVLVGEEQIVSPYTHGALRKAEFDGEFWQWTTWFAVDTDVDGFDPVGLAVTADGSVVYCSTINQGPPPYESRILKIHAGGSLVSSNGVPYDVLCLIDVPSAPTLRYGDVAGLCLSADEQYLYGCVWDKGYIGRCTLATGEWEVWWGPDTIDYLSTQEQGFEGGPSLGQWHAVYATSLDVSSAGADTGTHSLVVQTDGSDTVGSFDLGPVSFVPRFIPTFHARVRLAAGAPSNLNLAVYYTRGAGGSMHADVETIVLGPLTTSWVDIDLSTTETTFDNQMWVRFSVFSDDGSVIPSGDAILIDTASMVGPHQVFAQPQSVALGDDGYLYLADRGDDTIKRLDPVARTITPFAGTTGSYSRPPNHRDGPPGTGRIDESFAICTVPGKAFVSTLAAAVRTVDLATGALGSLKYSVSLVQGTAAGDSMDPPPVAAHNTYLGEYGTTTFFAPFDWPNGICCIPDGSVVFIADYWGYNVLAIDMNGQVDALIEEDDLYQHDRVDGPEDFARMGWATQAIAYIGNAPYAVRVGPGVGPGASTPRARAATGASTSRTARPQRARVRPR